MHLPSEALARRKASLPPLPAYLSAQPFKKKGPSQEDDLRVVMKKKVKSRSGIQFAQSGCFGTVTFWTKVPQTFYELTQSVACSFANTPPPKK